MWTLETGDINLHDNVSLYVYDENGELVCNNEAYYPKAVSMEHAQQMVDAVNRQKEMEQLLIDVRGWLFSDLIHPEKPLCRDSARKALAEINKLINNC